MSYITTKISHSKVNLEIQSGTKYDYQPFNDVKDIYVPPTVESFDALLARHNADVADIVKDLDLSEPADEFEF